MKKLELKTLGPEPAISYREILIEVCRRPLNPREGINIAEMRASLKVLDALDEANGTLELEDADFAHLKTKLDNMGWNVADRRILQLVDDVSKA